MLYKKLKSHPFWMYLIVGGVLLLVLSFTSSRRARRPCLALRAQIYPTELQFLTQSQLLTLANKHARRPIIGQSTKRLNLQDMEDNLRTHPFVRKVEVYRSHNGDVSIYLLQKEPIARLVYGTSRRPSEKYLTQRGELLSLSESFTARVPILELPYSFREEKSYWANPTHSRYQLWKMLREIREDPFWRAQIAYLSLGETNDLHLQTQLSRQVIYFGSAVDREKKFKKLRLLYSHILPQKGWNTYRKVDLRFRNQIVCK